MQKIKIVENENIINENKILLFDNPSCIYIPLVINEKNYLPIIKKGDYVYQGEKIAFRKSDHFPLLSPISGIVESLDNKAIIIENDYQNRTRRQKNEEYDLTSYSKEEVSKLLFEFGVQNINFEGEDAYLQLTPNRIFKSLIINALQSEAYVNLECFQLKIERKQLLEIIEAFIEIYNFEEALIVLPKHQDLLIEEWNKTVLDPKIKLIGFDEYYSLSNSKILIRKLKGIGYKKFPGEKGIVILNVSTLFVIYQVLKYQKSVNRLLVQLTGNMWKKNCYMEVRYGTYLKEALSLLEFKRTKEIVLLNGGLMNGYAINPEKEFILFSNTIYSAWKNIGNKESKNCIRCGRCAGICPSNLNPALIRDAVLKNRKLKRFKVDRCIECGICSYICPMNINLKETLLIAKEKENERIYN